MDETVGSVLEPKWRYKPQEGFAPSTMVPGVNVGPSGEGIGVEWSVLLPLLQGLSMTGKYNPPIVNDPSWSAGMKYERKF